MVGAQLDRDQVRRACSTVHLSANITLPNISI